MLGVSQFMDIFHLTPPGGGEALQAITASDQHGYATLVLAGFALLLMVIAMAYRGEQLGQMAAVAIAVCGVVALLIFLIGDLPKVNNVGTLDDPRQSFIDAEAKPVAGFWLGARRCARAHRLRRGPGDAQAPGSSDAAEAHGGRSHETSHGHRPGPPRAHPPRLVREAGLPAVVRERLVRLGHAVDVVLPLPGVALLLRGVHDLVGEALGHRLLAAPANSTSQRTARVRARRAGTSTGTW